MVTNVTSLTGNGLKDWLIQRVTAVYFAIYMLYLLMFLLMHPQLEYGQWHEFFHTKCFVTATIIAFVTLTLHSWIGIWTVTTDYIKCTVVRVSIQMLVAFWLIAQFCWGLMIIWG